MAKATRAVRRTLIGYWHESEDPLYSHPQPLVDHAWEKTRRDQIVKYLKSGYAYAASGGFSYCRFGCTQIYLRPTNDQSKGEYREIQDSYETIIDGRWETVVKDMSGYYISEVGRLLNGSCEYCDDVWCWPEGLAHYVETHGIRLPDEFVAHAVARADTVATAVANPARILVDDRFWREWCRTNAPFEYTDQCPACNPQG